MAGASNGSRVSLRPDVWALGAANSSAHVGYQERGGHVYNMREEFWCCKMIMVHGCSTQHHTMHGLLLDHVVCHDDISSALMRSCEQHNASTHKLSLLFEHNSRSFALQLRWKKEFLRHIYMQQNITQYRNKNAVRLYLH